MVEVIKDLGMQLNGCIKKARWSEIKCPTCKEISIMRASRTKAAKECGACAKRVSGTRVVDGYKTCSTCEVSQKVEEFYLREKSSDRYMSQCKTCLSTAASIRWGTLEGFSTRGIDRSRKYSLQTKYGLTINDFNNMHKECNGECQICKIHVNKLKGYNLYVDHCHTTGVIRGLLCNACNTALGNFKDDITTLENAILYLSQDMSDKKIAPGDYSEKSDNSSI